MADPGISSAVGGASLPAHTPGPWMGVYDGGYKTLVRTADNTRNIAFTAMEARAQANRHEDEANARLIAAAPDLLEALEWAAAIIQDEQDKYRTSQGGGPYGLVLEAARAAIAKALGPSAQDTTDPQVSPGTDPK